MSTIRKARLGEPGWVGVLVGALWLSASLSAPALAGGFIDVNKDIPNPDDQVIVEPPRVTNWNDNGDGGYWIDVFGIPVYVQSPSDSGWIDFFGIPVYIQPSRVSDVQIDFGGIPIYLPANTVINMQVDSGPLKGRLSAFGDDKGTSQGDPSRYGTDQPYRDAGNGNAPTQTWQGNPPVPPSTRPGGGGGDPPGGGWPPGGGVAGIPYFGPVPGLGRFGGGTQKYVPLNPHGAMPIPSNATAQAPLNGYVYNNDTNNTNTTLDGYATDDGQVQFTGGLPPPNAPPDTTVNGKPAWTFLRGTITQSINGKQSSLYVWNLWKGNNYNYQELNMPGGKTWSISHAPASTGVTVNAIMDPNPHDLSYPPVKLSTYYGDQFGNVLAIPGKNGKPVPGTMAPPPSAPPLEKGKIVQGKAVPGTPDTSIPNQP